MLFCNSKLVVRALPPATGSNGSLTKWPTVSVPPFSKPSISLQVRSDEERFQVQETVNSITRRDIMHMAAASLSGITLLLAGPCEARVRKPEVRRKIFEKLELEREKAGVSKQNGERMTPQPKESLPSAPSLQKRSVESLVEATMP